MERKFIKVKIMTDRCYRDGYIDLSSVIAFRESPYDVNVTIVYTESESFIIHSKFNEFCKKMGVI